MDHTALDCQGAVAGAEQLTGRLPSCLSRATISNTHHMRVKYVSSHMSSMLRDRWRMKLRLRVLCSSKYLLL